MQIAIYGPGRAGGALAFAFASAGHVITSIDGRTQAAVTGLRDAVTISGGDPDLLVLAVSDDALAGIHNEFDLSALPPAVVHVSGAVPVDALRHFADAGSSTGSFHPLQTLPDRDSGAERLPGSYVAITAGADLFRDLDLLARSIGCIPFRIDEANKALYHAGAAAAANFVVASLGIAHALMDAADVPTEAIGPLVEAIVANVQELGPEASLTGPIARGDVGTVAAQVEAVAHVDERIAEAFLSMARATATYAGADDVMAEVLE